MVGKKVGSQKFLRCFEQRKEKRCRENSAEVQFSSVIVELGKKK